MADGSGKPDLPAVQLTVVRRWSVKDLSPNPKDILKKSNL
jgi:hypothetical protein